MQIIEKVTAAVKFLKERGFDKPEVGIILGTGLGALVEEMEIEQEFVYSTSHIFQ